MNTRLSLTILSWSDKRFVLVISLLTLSLRAVASQSRVAIVSPFIELKLRTSLLSHTLGISSPIMHTEATILQGAGVGMFPRLLSPISVGAHVLPKAFMIMAAV